MNPETLKDTLCCNQPASIVADKKDGTDGFGVWCKVCGHARFDPIRENAIKIFLDEKPKKVINKPPVKENKGVQRVNNNQNNNNQIIPINRTNMIAVFEPRKRALAIMASPVHNGDKSAIERLMFNNIERYPLTLSGKAWDKVWSTPEGQASIVRGLEDSAMMGIELGKMGDLVPMGGSCTLIPSVEAYEFTLTNGNNAPFEWITIECIHENDEYSSSSKMGSFFFENKHGKPRGQVVACAAYGKFRNRDLVYGEIYDADRIMKSAEAHSTSYQYYLRDKNQFEALKSEGKTFIRNGREGFKKDMPPGPNGAWQKDIFFDELSNPYDSDREKMFMKATGKSVFAKFMKVRGSEAAMHEVRTQKDGVNEALNRSEEQFEDVESEVLD